MGRKPFTVTLEEEDIAGVRNLSEALGLSASAIVRAATQAVVAEPSLIVRRTLITSKQKSRRSKLGAAPSEGEP